MNLIIGSHVSYNNKSQLLGSVKEALSYKSNTFMFYTGAPQNTNRSVIEDSLTMEAYKLMKENNIALEKVIVHAPYIVNLANFNNFDLLIKYFNIRVCLKLILLGLFWILLWSTVNRKHKIWKSKFLFQLLVVLYCTNEVCTHFIYNE